VNSVITAVFLPVALAVVMLGLGLSLTAEDFRRVVRHPRAAAVALACQILLLPAICFGLVLALDLRPELAVGMMLLAASPGGTTASLFSHLFRGDVALNISLTAVNSLLALFTLPVVVNLSVAYFFGTGSSVGLQFGKVLQVFAIVLVPVALGMWIRRRAPGFAERMRRPVKVLSVLVLAAAIGALLLAERETIARSLGGIGLVVVLFGTFSLLIGYAVPRLLDVEPRQAIASAMEVGIHNSTLAIAVAVAPTLLDDPRLAVPAAVYGILIFGMAAVFGVVVTRVGYPTRVPLERRRVNA
jgi:bile acid:Na+ symporter, BASS family